MYVRSTHNMLTVLVQALAMELVVASETELVIALEQVLSKVLGLALVQQQVKL